TSSIWSPLTRRIFDQHDVEAARTMRAELDPLLDIAAARRAGDHVDRAVQSLWIAISAGADQIPAIRVARHDLAGAQYDDMGTGQKVQRRRRAGAGGEDQGASLG